MRNELLSRISSIAARKKTPQAKPEEAAVVTQRQRDRRQAPRVNTYTDSTLFLPSSRPMHIIIHDMSETGLRIGCESGLSLPDFVEVIVMQKRYNCWVAWRGTFEAGLEYWALVG